MSYIKNHAEYCGYLLGQEKRATTANPPVWSCVMVQLVGCFTFLNNTKKIYDIVHHAKAISKSLDYYIMARRVASYCGLTVDATASAGINCCSTVCQHKCM